MLYRHRLQWFHRSTRRKVMKCVIVRCVRGLRVDGPSVHLKVEVRYGLPLMPRPRITRKVHNGTELSHGIQTGSDSRTEIAAEIHKVVV